MTVVIQGTELRTIGLGRRVTKATGTLTAATTDLFVVTGQVLITSMYGLVTASITAANSYYLKVTPTTGDAAPLCTATDIGTTDSAAGDIIGFGLGSTTAAPKLLSPSGGSNAAWPSSLPPTVVTTGKIQSVSAGTDGNITWCLTWVPLSDDGNIVAA